MEHLIEYQSEHRHFTLVPVGTPVRTIVVPDMISVRTLVVPVGTSIRGHRKLHFQKCQDFYDEKMP